jgi:hypothetical protein
MEGTTERPRRRIFIEDPTGNKRREARIVADALIGELIPALITALGLPATEPFGRPIKGFQATSYSLRSCLAPAFARA